MLALRRAVIFVAQILALIFIVVATMAGALAGFFVSIVLAALFFLLIEIAYNTRNPFNQ